MEISQNKTHQRFFITFLVVFVYAAKLLAQNIDPNVPTGFAVVDGDGLQTTTGGANGQIVTATTYSELSSYCGSSNPLIILLDGAISGTGSIVVESNKTIIGKSTNATLTGFGLDMRNVSNIIIRNIKINGSVDGIAARSCHHLWIDHCEIWDCTDGLLDITVASSYCTVSWCKFYYVNQVDHRLACLIGNGGGTAPNDWGRNKVTYHHNWYGNKADQRMPRLMYGQGHVYNDYYSCTGNSYCIGVGSYAMALIENNYFKGVKNPHQFMYDLYCHITANGNSYENTTGTKDAGMSGTRYEVNQIFEVTPFTTAPYLYQLDNAEDIPTLITNGAAPKSEYSEIGLMPTPGQGAINISTHPVLSWKNGTGITPISYNVYVGTTTSPTQVATVTTQSYSPAALNNGTVYYWRVDVVTSTGTIPGKLWMFKTEEYVAGVAVTGVEVSPVSNNIPMSSSVQLVATVLPSNATNKGVSWSSSNTSIATVNESGIVTGIALGTTQIKVTTSDGGKVAEANINVIENAALSPLIKIEFNENTGSTISSTGTVSTFLTKSDIPVWSTNVPVNGGQSALDFGTTNGNYYVESNAVISQLGGLTDFTITGWVNCSSSTVGSGGNRIVSWINNGANGVDVVYMADGSLKVGVNQWPDKSTAISSTGKITTNAGTPASNWKFFGITYRSTDGQLQFYFGDNATTATLDKTFTYNQGAVGTSIGSLSIGHFNTQSLRNTRTDRMFKGLIDKIEIYDAVLSLNQIQLVQNNLIQKVSKTELSNKIKVYPNPVSDYLRIKLDNTTKNAVTIDIMSLTGKVLKVATSKEKDNSFDVSDLTPGIYLIKISDSEINETKMIVKQ